MWAMPSRRRTTFPTLSSPASNRRPCASLSCLTGIIAGLPLGRQLGSTSPQNPNVGNYRTRVMSFSWERSTDRLWRQGIDLIGDNRGGQVGEGIEDGAMLGQSEGGEFLDMPDDGFDDVAPVEQCLVEERHR